jgi:hypothetical protein
VDSLLDAVFMLLFIPVAVSTVIPWKWLSYVTFPGAVPMVTARPFKVSFVIKLGLNLLCFR